MRAVCDLGNSRLKWGVGQRTAGTVDWLATGALDYPDIGLLGDRLGPYFAADGAGRDVPVLFTCVASQEHEQACVQSLAKAGFRSRQFRSEARCAGLANGYRDPAQLGADRWAAVLGAWVRVGRSAIVVSAGTATTVDLILTDGGSPRFAGGLILPGVALMLSSLARGTARLPHARGVFADLPDNTDDAIHSGVIQAQLGAIDRMRAKLASDAPCLITGGNASLFQPYLSGRVERIDTLVLEGLVVAADD